MAAAERSDARELETRKRLSGGRPLTSGAGYRANRGRLECTSCGFIARASLGALERSGVPSCGCGAGPLVLSSELAAAADETRGALELERVSVAAARGAAREGSSGYRSGSCNCASCGAFKRRPADKCTLCGDEPAQYGPDPDAIARELNRSVGYAD